MYDMRKLQGHLKLTNNMKNYDRLFEWVFFLFSYTCLTSVHKGNHLVVRESECSSK